VTNGDARQDCPFLTFTGADGTAISLDSCKVRKSVRLNYGEAT
jgi:hypothetical protein